MRKFILFFSIAAMLMSCSKDAEGVDSNEVKTIPINLPGSVWKSNTYAASSGDRAKITLSFIGEDKLTLLLEFENGTKVEAVEGLWYIYHSYLNEISTGSILDKGGEIKITKEGQSEALYIQRLSDFYMGKLGNGNYRTATEEQLKTLGGKEKLDNTFNLFHKLMNNTTIKIESSNKLVIDKDEFYRQ